MLGGGPGGGSERELERVLAPLGPILLLGLRRHGTRGRPNAKISFLLWGGSAKPDSGGSDGSAGSAREPGEAVERL